MSKPDLISNADQGGGAKVLDDLYQMVLLNSRLSILIKRQL